MKHLSITAEDKKLIAKSLNQVLADYHLLYQNLRNFHWNVKGKNFFTLHDKFEELYNTTFVNIDEVAERILTLKEQPLSKWSQYLEIAKVKEASTNLTDTEMVETLLSNFEKLLHSLLTALETASEKEDEGTIDLLTGYVAELEKESWMLSSYLG